MARKLRSEQVDLSQYYNRTEAVSLTAGSNITITETEEGIVISSSGGGGGGSSDWADITNKPATFLPSAHTHGATDIASGTLDIARIPTGTTASTVSLGNHTHTVANITGLESTLTGLEDSVNNASTLVAGTNITLTPSGNNLTISASGGGGGGSVAWGDVTDKPTSFAPSVHNHSASDINSGTFAAARLGTGTPSSSNYLRGDGTWATIPSGGGSTAWSAITDKPATFAPSAHTHTIANVTDLQTALNGKEPSFTKNAAFNKNFGTVAGTVMQGNDSRIHSHSNKALLDLISQSNIDVLNLLSVVDGNIKVNTTLWATGGISALGLGEDGGGSGGGGVDMLDSWANYTTAKANYYVPASLLVPFRSNTLSRLESLEAGGGGGGGDVEIVTTGSGNAVTGVSKSGNTLTFAKSSTFALSTHTHTIANITGLQDALGGKEPSFTKNAAFNKNFGTTAGTVMQGNDSRVVNGQTAFGWGNHSSAGYALNTALTAHTGNSTIHITSTERTNWSDSNTKKHTHSNKALLDLISQSNIDVLNLLSVVDGNIKVNTTLWATGGLSALGLGEGGSGGSGGGVDMLDAWANYTAVKANYYVPASLLVPFRNDTLSRLESLEAGGGAIDIEVATTGSGNAITSLTKSGSVITATKGSSFALESHTHSVATTTVPGFMSASDKVKLNGITTGANNYVHPTADGDKHVPATGTTNNGKVLKAGATAGSLVWGTDNDTITTINGKTGAITKADIVALGIPSTDTNTITTINGKTGTILKADIVALGIPAQDTTYGVATTSADGLMSSTDKSKLNGIAANANNYSHPTGVGNNHIPSGGATGQFLKWSSSGVAVWAADNNTTYVVATTSANGLMSSTDKSKLDGIATGANNYSLPTASSTTLGGVKIGSNISISSGVISVAAPYAHPSTHPASMITGLHASATTGVAGSVAWGDVTNKPATFAPSSHTHSNITITAGNGLSGGGALSQDRTLTLGTPSTLTNATTNSATASTHTHAITTTTVGAANTIVATDASGGVRGSIIRIGGNWTLELSGTELVFKYQNVIKQRMLTDGTILATGGITALATN